MVQIATFAKPENVMCRCDYSPQTGVEKTFKFSHSTGPEFDPDTKWVYHAGSKVEGNLFTLIVHNEKELTAARAQAYLQAKLDQ